MLRHQKIRPKEQIPGYTDEVCELAEGGSLTDIAYIQRLSREKREHRISRVKRKHVLKACDRCRVKKTKVGESFTWLWWISHASV